MIIYASRTGNIRYIISKLNVKSVDMKDVKVVNERFILFTYTDGLGDIPKEVNEFMRQNYSYCEGVVCSGNSNFGHRVFCGAADKINQLYGIPTLKKVELRGFEVDYKEIEKLYNQTFGGN